MLENQKGMQSRLEEEPYRENHGEMLEVSFKKHLPPMLGEEEERLAERAMRDWAVLDRMEILTKVFERRKNSILKYIRSTDTKNMASVTVEDVKEGMAKYEEWAKTQKGIRSNLDDFFLQEKPEVVLEGNVYRVVRDQAQLLDLLATEVHKELFARTEFFKNVSGIFATRIDPSEGLENKDRETQVLLVKNKNGIWQFPGGKAEYVCRNPDTGRTEVVTKKDNVWQFANGKEALQDQIVFETPDECLRREISEELGTDVGLVSLGSSGFYTIGSSRFLIHGFVANNLLDADPEKANKEEIKGFEWTSNPLAMPDGSPRPLTDQTKDVLGRLFLKTASNS